MNNAVKSIVIGAIAAILLVVIAYVKGSSDKDKEWRLRLATAERTIDSLRSVQIIPQQPAHVETYQKPKPLSPDYKAKLDSATAAGFAKGRDSLDAFIQWIAQPMDTTLQLYADTTTYGSLHAAYWPLTHIGSFDFQPVALKKELLVIHDSVAVPVPESLPWYREPAIAVIGMGVGAAIILFTVHK